MRGNSTKNTIDKCGKNNRNRKSLFCYLQQTGWLGKDYKGNLKPFGKVFWGKKMLTQCRCITHRLLTNCKGKHQEPRKIWDNPTCEQISLPVLDALVRDHSSKCISIFVLVSPKSTGKSKEGQMRPHTVNCITIKEPWAKGTLTFTLDSKHACPWLQREKWFVPSKAIQTSLKRELGGWDLWGGRSHGLVYQSCAEKWETVEHCLLICTYNREIWPLPP